MKFSNFLRNFVLQPEFELNIRPMKINENFNTTTYMIIHYAMRHCEHLQIHTLSPFFCLSGTFKLKKLALQREGYNPNVIQDEMFFLDAVKGAYRQLDNCLYNDIIHSRCRL